MDLSAPDVLMPGFRQYARCCDEIEKIIDGVIEARLGSSSLESDVDLLAFMLRSHEATGYPSIAEMRDEVKTLLFAGTNLFAHPSALWASQKVKQNN